MFSNTHWRKLSPIKIRGEYSVPKFGEQDILLYLQGLLKYDDAVPPFIMLLHLLRKIFKSSNISDLRNNFLKITKIKKNNISSLV